MRKSLDDKILDLIGKVLWQISLPFFPLVDKVPDPLATWLHRTGSWIGRKSLMITDRNEEWMQIDKHFYEDQQRESSNIPSSPSD